MLKEGKVNEGFDYWQKALQLNSDSWEIYVQFGELLQARNQIPEAINLYQQAIDINPYIYWP